MLRPLSLAAVLALMSACTVGEVTGNPGPSPGPDADVSVPDADPAAPDADPASPDAAPAAACVDAVPNPPGGHHNAGQACIACHINNGGPDYTIAGTLYGPGGTTPLAGATIVVTDANGQTVNLVTATNGNFMTTQQVAFPIQVAASRCPDTTPMSGAVTAPADCNKSGCHAASGGAGRITLP